jgi:hypothetical protein
MSGTSKPLKRLIIDPKTGRFLKRDGGWTAEETEAMDFEDIAALLRSCSKHRVKNAEVLLRFNSAHKFDVRFPLPH